MNLILNTVHGEKQRIDALRQQIDRRKHIETMIKSLLEEKALADRILEGNL